MRKPRNKNKKATTLPDMASLSLAEAKSSIALENLPYLVLSAIISHLTTAQSLARLASTCKKLRVVIREHGWRVFVCNRFPSLILQAAGEKDKDWTELAKRLTCQSRAWDRRAFSVATLLPPDKDAPDDSQFGGGRGRRGGGRGRGRGGRGGRDGRGGRGGRSRMQTYPPQIVVDADLKLRGSAAEEETLALGVGEDVVIRWRESKNSSVSQEHWGSIPGATTGFHSGADDVTAISLLSNSTDSPAVLVGRASGYLQLSSISTNDFGRSIAWFLPPPSQVQTGNALGQTEIQHFDVNASRSTTAVVTRDNLFFYPVPETWSQTDQNDLHVEPKESIQVRKLINDGQGDFGLLQQARFMENGDLALGMSSSSTPLRYLTRTSTGTVLTNAAKMRASERCTETYIYGKGSVQTLRAILPVTRTSVPGGSGSVVLSSYDDGTIRLQDVRTSSAIDTIYQDHFEVTTPVGPLLSYGSERFIVGSARDRILKIFDYRWPKNYSYTDALPCSESTLGPTPKPLNWLQSPPQYPAVGSCSHLTGKCCRLHALARTTFYRPNCNVYLPVIRQHISPVYSLAKASDLSPVVYAGLAGELVQMRPRDAETDALEAYQMQAAGDQSRCGFGYRSSFTSIVETSDGFALSDITKSSRVPAIYRQRGIMSQEFRRLDEALT